MKALAAIVMLLLAGCAEQSTRSAQPAPAKVVILGNRTTPAVCTNDADAERARAERWKAYAEKLETALGLPHEGERKP